MIALKRVFFVNFSTNAFKFFPDRPFPTLLEWKVVTKKFPWNIVLLLGAGFAMAKAAKVCLYSCSISGGGLPSYKFSINEVV